MKLFINTMALAVSIGSFAAKAEMMPLSQKELQHMNVLLECPTEVNDIMLSSNSVRIGSAHYGPVSSDKMIIQRYIFIFVTGGGWPMFKVTEVATLQVTQKRYEHPRTDAPSSYTECKVIQPLKN